MWELSWIYWPEAMRQSSATETSVSCKLRTEVEDKDMSMGHDTAHRRIYTDDPGTGSHPESSRGARRGVAMCGVVLDR